MKKQKIFHRYYRLGLNYSNDLSMDRFSNQKVMFYGKSNDYLVVDRTDKIHREIDRDNENH